MKTPDGRMPNASFKLSQDALKALRSGNKIEAIRAIREATGVGLAEAKSIVEEIEKAMPSVGAAAVRVTQALSLPGTGTGPGPGLGPGEVARTGGTTKWLALIAVAIIVILAALYY